jgi:hypothetical protein
MATAAVMAGQAEAGRANRRPSRRHGKRSALGLGAAGALILGAGCAQESNNDLVAGEQETAGASSGFAATPEYIDHVVDTAEEQSYRYTLSFEFDMFGSNMDGEIAQGSTNGEQSELTMDFGAMFEQMGSELGEEVPPELAGDGMTMQQVVDGDTLYIRAPFFANMSEGLGVGDISGQPGGELFGVFADLGDGWGKVDVSALGDILPGEAGQAVTGQTMDPGVYLEMLRGADAVEELGSDEIDGVEVEGLAAEVSFEDLIAAAGTDPGTLGEALPGEMESVTFPLDVWVDGDDQVRRLTFNFDAESLADIAGEDASDLPSEMGDFSMGMTVDFTDYGDDITVDVPRDATDITDEFVAAYEDIQGG